MPSVWLTTHTTSRGAKRHRCYYRLGGRASSPRYAGSFETKREALLRRAWVAGELAALRVPDLRQLKDSVPVATPTVAIAAKRWLESRIDHAAGTRIAAQGNINRFLPMLGKRRCDEVTSDDVADLVAELRAKGRKRETIKKSVGALAMTLDHAGIQPNPARLNVRLPPDDTDEIRPPTAGQVSDMLAVIAAKHRLPVLVLEATGMRVGELEGLRWGDLDEPRDRWLVRKELNHTRRDRWVSPPPDLLAAVLELVPREDRDADALVFPEANQAALRTELARACKRAGVPKIHPHALRHRRISLWHRQGIDWARIGEWVGQRSRSVTADTYTHVLADGAEIDHAGLLG